MVATIDPTSLAHRIEHTLLRPGATRSEVAQLCREAMEHRFAAVCVSGCRVIEAAALL